MKEIDEVDQRKAHTLPISEDQNQDVDSIIFSATTARRKD